MWSAAIAMFSIFAMSSAAAIESDFELFSANEDTNYELSARTFSGFNTTTLLAVFAVGAVIILIVAVGLYVYDVYADTHRASYLEDPDYVGYYQSQYENAEQAYPFYQKRWVSWLVYHSVRRAVACFSAWLQMQLSRRADFSPFHIYSIRALAERLV